MSAKLKQQRREANKALLAYLLAALEADHDLRFSQALCNYDFVKMSQQGTPHWKDEYYTEPMDVLRRVDAAFQRLSAIDSVGK